MGAGVGAFLKEWWTRPGGGHEVVSLAVPMIISSGSIALMQLTDRVFMTWLDPMAMGATFSAGNFLWFFVAFPFFVAGYCNAFVSQYNGSRQYDKIAPIVWQGIFLGAAVMPTYLIFAPWYESCFLLFRHSPQLAKLEGIYLFYSVWGLAPMVASEALAAFFCGRKKMTTVMSINVVFVAVNIVLDYLLIFGVYGWCAWGLAGAAIATTISQWLRCITFFIFVFREDKKTGLFHFAANMRFNWKVASKLLTFGGMSGIQSTIEVLAFTSFIMLVGMIGDAENAATAIAFTMNSLTFLPVVGAGIAVVSLVGNRLGENQSDLARRCVLTAVTLAVCFTGVFVVLFIFVPDLFLFAYAWQDPEGFAPIRGLTIVLLRYVAIYLFFDTINIVFCSAMKGAGDMRFVITATLVMAPMLSLPTWFGLSRFGLGIHWPWTVATLWTFVLAIIYSARFFSGRWMKMRLFSPKENGLSSSDTIK